MDGYFYIQGMEFWVHSLRFKKLTELSGSQKAVLLVDNCAAHPNAEELTHENFTVPFSLQL